MTDDNVIFADFRAIEKLLEPKRLRAIMRSQHPDAEALSRWLCDECLPAIDPFGFRGPPGSGRYVWPGTRAEFNHMLRKPLAATRRPRITGGIR